MIVPLTYEEWLEQGQPSVDGTQDADPNLWDFYARLNDEMRIVSFGRCLKRVQ
jgi:hypothetical protein